jgi:hypothetical protein
MLAVSAAQLALAGVAPAATPLGPAALTIYAAPDPSIAGQPVLVSGQVPGVGPGTRVALWEQLGGAASFTPVGSTTTGTSGAYQFLRRPKVNGAWSVTALGFHSRTVRVRVQAHVSLQAVPAASGVRFAGLVSPSHAGESVTLERYAGGRWRQFARPRLDLGSDFASATPLALPAEVRAVLAGDPRNSRSISAAVMTVAATLGAASAMPPNYYGVNWDYGGAAMFSRDLTGEYADLAALHPGTLRWPGGTGANYFQWQLGYPLDIGERNGFTDTLVELAAAYAATGAPPVFDLNVMTSDLPTQEDMLFVAQQLGLPIRYVELGNELYFDAYEQQVPDATSYGQTVAAYVNALHSNFPGVLVAADAASGSGPARYTNWNYDMLMAAQQAGGPPDAVAIHDKPGWIGPVASNQLPTLFAMPYWTAQLADSTLAALPYPEPAWMTEYNLYPELASNPVHGTFANALLVAEDALLMRSIPNATLTDYWTAFSGSRNSAYVRTASGAPALTLAGLALQWVETAAGGATTSARITFGGPTLWPDGPAALVGYQFAGGHDVIVNLSPSAVIAPAGAAIPAGLPYEQVGANPTQQLSSASELTVTSGSVGSGLTLPPYSITRVGP